MLGRDARIDDADGDAAPVDTRLVSTAGLLEAEERAARVGRRLLELLGRQHNESLADAGIAPASKVNDYSVALNGYSALMTKAQADAIRLQKGVVRVMEDELQQPTTEILERHVPRPQAGRWCVPDGVSTAAVSPSASSIRVSGPSIRASPTSVSRRRSVSRLGSRASSGTRQHNPNDKPFTCNNKLIGARQMLHTYRELIGAEDYEFDSARARMAMARTLPPPPRATRMSPRRPSGIPRGNVTGIAPRAHIVAYKGLGDLGGFTSDLTEAIDQAVADGVDVINYSIGGGASLTGSDDIAFLFAANANVWVATSAGNSGNGAGTIGGPANLPWVTTVGANTQTRSFQGTVVLRNGARFTGVSITHGVSMRQVVDAQFHATGPTPDLCVPGTLSPSVAGKIVLCRRGVIGRVEKSQAVMLAGGKGMILYENDDKGDLMSDSHWVPTVHVDNTPGLAIKAYIANTFGPTAGSRPASSGPHRGHRR